MTQKKVLSIFEILIIIGIALFPLLLSFPFRVNIFLSWEGAYRMSEGQLPFRDFGTPLGGMYWVVPAIFFKIFGAQLITLVKAQAFINIISGLVFRQILIKVSVIPAVRAASVLLYSITFSFFNFWPWYNHTAIVYGLISIAFILQFIFSENDKSKWLWILLASLFTFFSFFTKQDAGGLMFFIGIFLLLYISWLEKRWLPSVVYAGGTVLFTVIAVLFFSQFEFSYWFNHGQPPHNARVSGADIINEFFSESQWLKFYIFIIVLLSVARFKDARSFLADKRETVFLLLTLGILCLAAIFQITSYTPVNSNIFFHGFAFAFIMHYLIQYLPFKINNTWVFSLLSIGIMLWWSQLYWNYIQRIFIKSSKEEGIVQSATGENVVGLHNARLRPPGEESTIIPQGKWIYSNLPTLKKIKLPEPTVMGIQRLMELDIVKNKKDIKVLNMSELTFLAAEIPYALERSPRFPLWYHLGVGMFNREAEMFEDRIRNNYYDVVLFEYMPGLNNFYPFRVRDTLKLHYQQIDSFIAPRNSEPGTIEIYIKKP